MTIVVSNGFPKSGSTLVQHTCIAVAERLNGMTMAEFKSAIGMPDLEDYVDSPDEELISNIEKTMPARDGMIILKSHSSLDTFLQESVSSGRISLVASFRDPRDTALSMLDAGRSERKAGSSRHFYQFEQIEQVIRPIKWHSRNLAKLCRLPNVCLIPFHLIANDFPFVVGMIADHLRASHLRDQAFGDVSAQIFDLPEFNKGIADRFVSELSEEDLNFVCENLKEETALYDLCFRNILQRFGRLKQAEDIIADRDSRIARRLRSPKVE